MGRDISIFADYHKQENTVTNYCGLLMKLLYENSSSDFEEFISSIVEDDNKLKIGPKFNQQTKQETSIPDLAITQNSFAIFFETKLNGWSFNPNQIKNHINNFNKLAEIKILFLLSNFDIENPNEKFKEQIEQGKSVGLDRDSSFHSE